MTTDIIPKHVVSVVTTSDHALNTCCVRWSANNWIAVTTDKHIIVLNTRSDPRAGQQSEYLKTVIPIPDKPMAFDCGLTIRQVLDICDTDRQHILMCDPSLAGETANSGNMKAYRRVEWSPICPQWGSLLGALTLDHRLVIYTKEVDEWKPTIDLSVILNEKLKQLWSDTSVHFETYTTRMYSLATFCFCWAQDWRQSVDSSLCRLWTASKNGLIAFWDISVRSGQPVLQISADVVYKWDSSLNQINCVKSFDNLLIISSIKGTVCVIHTELDINSSPVPLLLWSEEDGIQVNDFAIKSMDSNVYEIVFPKSDFLIICRFSADAFENTVQLSLRTCKVVSGLHRMPSTAICPIIDAKYLLSSMDGRLIEVDISDDLTVTQSEISLDGIDSMAMCAYGVDSSFNGVLSVVVQGISQLYDHLMVKESVRIVIFSNVSLQDLSDILYNNFLAEEPAIDKTVSFDEYFDYLDCTRSLLPTDINSGLTTYLSGLTADQSLITECRQIHKLRIIRFIARTYLQVTKDMALKIGLETSAKLCEDIIRRLFFEQMLNQLVSNSQTLTQSQLLSIKNMNSWHISRFFTPLIHHSKLSTRLSSVVELCPICAQPIPFESHLYGRCPDSHRFDRCCNSLVLLDFVRHKYRKCDRCVRSLVSVPESGTVGRGLTHCLFCL